MDEAMANFAARGVALDTLRLRAFPFPASVNQFFAEHEHVFVVEQNRDGQIRSLLINELGIDPAHLIAVLHYDGTPIPARFIYEAIGTHIAKSAAAKAPIGRAPLRQSVTTA